MEISEFIGTSVEFRLIVGTTSHHTPVFMGLQHPSAYTELRLFKQTKIVTDTVAEIELVVYRDPQSEASAIYERVVEGQPLAFKPGSTWTTLEDSTTGSTWSMITGKAISGPLQGK